MTAAHTGTVAPEIPAQWPASLAPATLGVIDLPTPYLVTDLDVVAQRHAAFSAALPGVLTCYAMKCNPAPEILRTLAARGSSFEIASLGELRALQTLGIDPATVLYSNPVKPPAHITEAYAAGLWRFSFDSPGELAKIAECAPGSAVYVRLGVDDSTSVFPLSRKFGTDVEDAYDLMLLARRLGLRPYGVTFHVGSQCGSPAAWRAAIAARAGFPSCATSSALPAVSHALTSSTFGRCSDSQMRHCPSATGCDSTRLIPSRLAPGSDMMVWWTG